MEVDDLGLYVCLFVLSSGICDPIVLPATARIRH